MVGPPAVLKGALGVKTAGVTDTYAAMRRGGSPEDIVNIRGLGATRVYILEVADRLGRLAAGAEARDSESGYAAVWRAVEMKIRRSADPSVLRRLSPAERREVRKFARVWDPLVW